MSQQELRSCLCDCEGTVNYQVTILITYSLNGRSILSYLRTNTLNTLTACTEYAPLIRENDDWLLNNDWL